MNVVSRPALPIAVALWIVLLTACRPQPVVPPVPTQDKPYYDEAYGSFDSIRLKTDAVTGLWQNGYAIKASGTAINMTKTNSLIAFSISHHAGIFTGEGQPVIAVFQSELAATKYSKLPATIHHIIYDDEGNSLWLKINSITMSLFNPLMPVFNGESTVAGGTGKFTNSRGSIYFSGQLDIVHPFNSMIRNEGIVTY